MTGVVSIGYDVPNSAGDMIIDVQSPCSGERFEKFAELAAVAKANGSLIIAQVGHPGRQMQAKLSLDGEVIAPSAVPLGIERKFHLAAGKEGRVELTTLLEPRMGRNFARPRAATHAEISDVVASIAHSAAFLEQAGFNGIQLHAAHGYLLAQFLAPSTNKRTDEFGGSLDCRMRIIKEAGLAVRAATGPGFILGIKLNSVEFQDQGFTPEDAARVCTVLQDDVGFDFVELSGGTYEKIGHNWAKESTSRREGFFLKFAESIVPALGEERKTKVYLTGGLRTVDSMNRALDVVDGLGIGRPAAQEPSFAAKILSGEITAAVKPVPPFEDDSGMGNVIGGAQMRQIAQGQQPFDMSNQAAMNGFLQDLEIWQELNEKDDRNERVGWVTISASSGP
ncbi:hypothetical protein FALCPG4_012595 [Fusarium falciforme]